MTLHCTNCCESATFQRAPKAKGYWLMVVSYLQLPSMCTSVTYLSCIIGSTHICWVLVKSRPVFLLPCQCRSRNFRRNDPLRTGWFSLLKRHEDFETREDLFWHLGRLGWQGLAFAWSSARPLFLWCPKLSWRHEPDEQKHVRYSICKQNPPTIQGLISACW